MTEQMKLTNTEAAALNEIETVLRPTAKGAETLDATDLCDKYHSIRAALVILVAILKKIPGIGAQAAVALEFLMGLADSACPIS